MIVGSTGTGACAPAAHAYGRLQVSAAVGRRIRRGHPWIWDRAIERVWGQPGQGDVVEVVAPRGRSKRLHVLGFAFFDPKSALRARMVGGGVEPSSEWAADLAGGARRLREQSRTLVGTNAMRLVHGESDRMSGLVIDRYGLASAIQFDGVAAANFWRPYLGAICETLSATGIRGAMIRGRGTVWGEAAPSELLIEEDEARFEVDLEHGQKTGLFLDQRPHRRQIRALVSDGKGKRVLNLFSYTGGFSVHAALGGAGQVVSVDSAQPAMAAAKRNFVHSGIESDASFVVADVFEFLKKPAHRGKFDVVICDPPSFAPRHSAVAKALRAYANLNRLAVGAVRRNGILMTASCSSHVTTEQFDEAVASGLRAARRCGRVISRGGAGADHPQRPGFPEGAYLKVNTLQID